MQIGRERANLHKILNDANSAYKKNADYGAASAQWKAVQDRLTMFKANPDGLKVTARNKLPQC